MGGFVWRTPLLPVEDLLGWGAGLAAADTLDHSGSGELAAALVADRSTLRGRLAATVERAEIREAITVGSPGLESVIDLWREQPTGKRGRSIERGLVRYLTRMATRPTPFGLFAGIATCELGDATRLTLAGWEGYRHSQIDTDVPFALADHLGRDADVRRQVELRPNDSHYRVAGQVRYVQARQDGERPAYRLATLPDHPAMAPLFERAGHGATHIDLVDALVEDGYADAPHRAVDRLIERQALHARRPFHAVLTKPASDADLGPRVLAAARRTSPRLPPPPVGHREMSLCWSGWVGPSLRATRSYTSTSSATASTSPPGSSPRRRSVAC